MTNVRLIHQGLVATSNQIWKPIGVNLSLLRSTRCRWTTTLPFLLFVVLLSLLHFLSFLSSTLLSFLLPNLNCPSPSPFLLSTTFRHLLLPLPLSSTAFAFAIAYLTSFCISFCLLHSLLL